MSITLTFDDVRRALDPARFDENQRDDFIRDCFDTLFYFMAMMEHYISTTLIREDDVAYPLEYHVPLLANLQTEVSAYLSKYNLWRTRKYLSRYQVWRQKDDRAQVSGGEPS